MELEGKLALVTGGANGIGLAITEALSAAGASVLIVGRDQARLEAVRAKFARVSILKADLAHPEERQRLIDHVETNQPPLDILINNAGIMQYFLLTQDDALKRLDKEIALDLQAPIHLATAFLPGLLKRPQAAIVNVSTGLVYAPFGNTPGYSAAKGGLHAFTRSLRWQTKASNLQVIELFPPTVDTDLTKNYNGPKIKTSVVAAALLNGLRSGKTEVRPGQSKALYIMSRIAPDFIFNILNKQADQVPLD